jgi:glycosidase
MSKKVIIYQVFTRLFGNGACCPRKNGTIDENGCGKFNAIGATELSAMREMGISHVWYTGVIRHATQTDYTRYGLPANHPAVVKGKAGSPYAITDYYDVDPDLAESVPDRMAEFEALVRRTHDAGLKIIIDFVPNHVARQYHSVCKPAGVADLGEGDDSSLGFTPKNNFYYCPGCKFSPQFSLDAEGFGPYVEMPAKATGNDHFDPSPGVNDWYETVKLNYGVDYYAGRVAHFDPVPDTWHKMLAILLYWAAKGIDGFRCDMAEMVPADFWHWATGLVKQQHPGIVFIGEVYNPAEYRNYISSGFDYLYDKVGMYDTLRGVTCGYMPASSITGAWQAVDDINCHMLYFLENHDEQRIASDYFAGDGWRGVPALVVSALMRRSPFMLYAGQEYGERGMDEEGFSGRDGRTTIFDYWSVGSLSRASNGTLTDNEKQLAAFYAKVLGMASTEKAVTEGEFFDLMYVNGHSGHFNPDRQYAFLRKSANQLLLVVANFSDTAVEAGVTIPAHAFDFLGFGEKRCMATDLLTGRRMSVSLVRDGIVTMPVGAWGACVLKLNTSAHK